ncbi:unnamed protein product [Lathyrus sativus]|nr:unnamed protein product [Lathyrus sativus]
MRQILGCYSEKYHIDFDLDTFQPIGQYAAKFKSYLLFIARSQVNLNEKKWEKISKNMKGVIWNDITDKFTCPTDDKFRKHWFVYMGERLKQFKTLSIYFGKAIRMEIQCRLKSIHSSNKKIGICLSRLEEKNIFKRKG